MFRKKDLANKKKLPIVAKKKSAERKNYFEGGKSSNVNFVKCIVCFIPFIRIAPIIYQIKFALDKFTLRPKRF